MRISEKLLSKLNLQGQLGIIWMRVGHSRQKEQYMQRHKMREYGMCQDCKQWSKGRGQGDGEKGGSGEVWGYRNRQGPRMSGTQKLF